MKFTSLHELIISKKRTFRIIGVEILIFVALYSWPEYQHAVSLGATQKQDFASEIAHLSSSAPLSLITEPDDGILLVEDLIEHAEHSVDMVMYQLLDDEVIHDLVLATERGVKVRVLLNRRGPFNKFPNQPTYDYLSANNVSVKWAPSYFTFTHQKTLVVDGAQALIMTFNLAPKYYESSRDFGVLDSDSADVHAIEAAFDADWDSARRGAESGADLVWSPGSSEALLDLVNNATSSLLVYNEEMADVRITKALEAAAKRGVTVGVVMTYATNWKPAFTELVNAGVDVKTFASTGKLYIHAKVIIVDSHIAFVGSENFSVTSLESNRELGIFIARPDILESLIQTFEQDYQSARPFVAKN